MDETAGFDAHEALAQLETRLRELERELAGTPVAGQPPAPSAPASAQLGAVEDARAKLGALREAIDAVADSSQRLRAAVRELHPPG